MAIVLSGSTGIDAGSLPVANTGKISAGSGLPAILNTAGVDRVIVDTAGNVGIGTSSPNVGGSGANDKVLTIKGNTTGYGGTIELQMPSYASTSGDMGFIKFFNGTTENARIYANPDGANTDSGKMLFYTRQNGGTLTERMRIDSTGCVKMPYQPAFFVSSTGYSNTYNINPVLFNTIRLNVGNNYNSSTGRFTAPVSGNYQINVFNNMINPNTADTILNKNGVDIAGVEHDNAATNSKWDGRGFSVVVPMVVGDYLTVKISGSSSITTPVEADIWNGFSGFLIG